MAKLFLHIEEGTAANLSGPFIYLFIFLLFKEILFVNP